MMKKTALLSTFISGKSLIIKYILGVFLYLAVCVLLLGSKSVDDSVVIYTFNENVGNVYVKVPPPSDFELVSSRSGHGRAVFVSNLKAWEQSQELTKVPSEAFMLLDVGFGLPFEDLDVRTNIERMLAPREAVFFGDIPDADFGTLIHSDGTAIELFCIVKINDEYLRVFIVCQNSQGQKYTVEDWEAKKKYISDWIMRFKEVNNG